MNAREAGNIRFLVLLGRNRMTVDRTIGETALGGPEALLGLAWLTLRHSLEAMPR